MSVGALVPEELGKFNPNPQYLLFYIQNFLQNFCDFLYLFLMVTLIDRSSILASVCHDNLAYTSQYEDFHYFTLFSMKKSYLL